MTLILDMATGAVYPKAAPGDRNSDATRAQPPVGDQAVGCIDLRLAVVESTVTDQRPCMPLDIQLSELKRKIED